MSSLYIGDNFIRIDQSWAEFKATVAAKNLNIQYVTEGDKYLIFGVDEMIVYVSLIWISGPNAAGDAANKTDFDNNYKDTANGEVKPDVAIREEYGNKTGGNFGSKCISLYIDSSDPGEVSSHNFSFPIPISLFSAQFIGSNECGGDEVEMHVASDTLIGLLTADVAVDDDIITVSPGAYSYLKVGYYMTLTAAPDYNDLGIVMEKQTNNKIKVQNKATTAFAAATPTYVLMTIKMIPFGRLPASSRLVIGESKIGGTYLPANTTIDIVYKNLDGVAKNLEFWLEYMY